MTTALASPPDTAIADLVLVRMAMPGKRPAAPGKMREDVGKLLNAELSNAEFNDLRSDLASAGFLTRVKKDSFALTDAGRERAMHFLGIAEIPPRMKWSTVIAKYVFPRAAGLSASAADKLERGITWPPSSSSGSTGSPPGVARR